MNIFYINLATFNKEIIENFARTYNDGRNFTNELKKLQHYAGIYLVDYVAKNYFNVSDTTIFYKNSKPFFKNSELNFNISHSRNIVLAVFAIDDIGVDVEYNKEKRNFSAILNRYDEKIDNFTSLSEQEQCKEFYEFWTKHEAKIKLDCSSNNEVFYSTIDIENDYTLSIATLKTALIEKLIDINT